jgi:predicted DNA binding CopG/RHH family protein
MILFMRKQVTTNVEENLLKLLKIEAVRDGVNYNILLEEAISSFLKSRGISIEKGLEQAR